MKLRYKANVLTAIVRVGGGGGLGESFRLKLLAPALARRHLALLYGGFSEDLPSENDRL